MSRAQFSDRVLVDAVLSGDREAYRALVERESASVLAACAKVLGDHEEAKDVAQDAFVQAYRSLASYRGDGTFGAWIGRIAKRKAVERSAAVRRRRATMSESDALLRSASPAADPELQAMAVEHSDALRRAINSLPPDQREIVSLRFYQDMSIEGIAARTGAPVGTVKSRLHRALDKLRDQNDLRSVS